MRDPAIVYVFGLTLVCYLQQVSPQQNGDVRLLDGSSVSQLSGRLEVYSAGTAEWGTVCRGGFTLTSASTVCRQLGYAAAERYNTAELLRFGVGNGSILFSEVTCDGNDNHILRCDIIAYTSLASTCDHDDDVAVICSPEPAFQYEGGVRLVGGPYRSEGTLEVFVYDMWYTLCAESLSSAATNAVCYQLGYTGIRNSSGSSSSNTSISLPTSDCASGSFCFGLCYTRPTTMPGIMQTCSSSNFYLQCEFLQSDASPNLVGSTLFCDLGLTPNTAPQHGDLRLVNILATSQYSGRLEIFDATSNQWGTICDDGFDRQSANTACKQLGSSGASQFRTAVQLGYAAGTGPILLTQVRCGDDDNHILRCRVQGINSVTSQCTHANDVGIMCSSVPALQYEGGVRLVDGPYRSQGTLEVFVFNQWYRLCGAATIPTEAARAVCRQLGYTQSDQASVMQLASDVGLTWNTDIGCLFSTTCFSECYQRPPTIENVVQSCNFATSIYIRCGFDLSISRISPVGTTAECSLSSISDEDEEEPGGLNGGAVAGIVIVSLVIVGVIVFFIVNKDAQKKLREKVESIRRGFRNFGNGILDGLRNCCNGSGRNSRTTLTPATNYPPPTRNEPAVTTAPPHEDVTLTAVHPVDPNKPPDYNDALQYRKSIDDGYPEPSLVDDGYPEPSLVDQPPSYDSVN